MTVWFRPRPEGTSPGSRVSHRAPHEPGNSPSAVRSFVEDHDVLVMRVPGSPAISWDNAPLREATIERPVAEDLSFLGMHGVFEFELGKGSLVTRQDDFLAFHQRARGRKPNRILGIEICDGGEITCIVGIDYALRNFMDRCKIVRRSRLVRGWVFCLPSGCRKANKKPRCGDKKERAQN